MNFRAIDDFIVVHDADGKPGEVVLIFSVKPRHFSGFTANERTFGLLAPFADAGNDAHCLSGRADGGKQLNGCELEANQRRICEISSELGTLVADGAVWSTGMMRAAPS